MGLVEERLLVDGIAQRAAECRIQQGLGRRPATLDVFPVPVPGLVELQLHPAGELARDRHDVRLALELLELLDRDAPGAVDVAALERLDHRVGVLEDLDVDLVGRALLPVPVGVANQVDRLIRCVFGDLVLAGSHERRLEVDIADRLVGLFAVDVLGQDRDGGLEDLGGPVVRVQEHRLGVRALGFRHSGILQPGVDVAIPDVRVVVDRVDVEAEAEDASAESAG